MSPLGIRTLIIPFYQLLLNFRGSYRMKNILNPVNQPKIRKFILLILIAICVLSTLAIIFLPSRRTGPFGIGLPSPMSQYTSLNNNFSIEYPNSWTIGETPQGSHGDKEIIAAILVPGRSFPQVYIARKSFLENDINQVALWGQSRAENRCECTPTSFEYFDTPYFHGVTQEYSWKTTNIFNITSTINCRDWYVQYNTEGYALSFCAYQQHWAQVDDVFKEMMNSFSVR